MAQRRIDGEIDRLYQLPPEEFTAARNALAKQAGGDGAEVRGLAKPPVAAWAVNQLYWNRRPAYAALIDASEEVRRTHTAVLAGKKGDLRASGKAHEQAVEAALKATLGILEENGNPATDSTRQAVVTTLRALPVEGELPGRLTRVLQPGGFEMLAGLSISGVPARRTAEPPPRAAGRVPASQKPKAPAAKPRDLKALARAREASARAARELREAEHVARRQEFEAARAAREAEKAVGNIESAREALEAAKQGLAEAEAAAASTARARDAAERRSGEADKALEAARARAGAAATALAKLTD